MSGMSSDDTEWRFDVGDELVKQDHAAPQVPGAAGEAERTVYTVKRRLVNEDTDERHYQVEWEEETTEPSLSDVNVRRMLKSGRMVDGQYRKVDAATERDGGGA